MGSSGGAGTAFHGVREASLFPEKGHLFRSL